MHFNRGKYFFLIVATLSWADASSQQGTTLKKLLDNQQTQSKIRSERIEDFKNTNTIPLLQKTQEGRQLLLTDVVNGIPIFVAALNNEAALTTGASKIQSGLSGLDLQGEGILIGVWDEGSVKDHIELGNRVLTKEVNNDETHATHVTGTLIATGLNANAKGMAPKATVTNWFFDNDLAEMTALAKPDESSLLLSNHSYGTVTGWTKINGVWNWTGDPSIAPDEDYRFGLYGTKAAALDQLANLAPYYTIVWAAGNDRGEPGDGSRPPDCNGGTGYDCIIPESVAKNIITIGAINKLPTYTGPSSVVMSTFSSWGPTDDGRIKPDLVGAGVSLFSLSADGTDTYGFLSGTSMATPNVTGSLALLHELYSKLHAGAKMKSATLKALAIHSAKEAGLLPGPDYTYGWGLLDAEAAAKLLVNQDGINTIVREDKLINNINYELTLNPKANQKMTATLVWNDPAAEPLDQILDPTQLMLVNDLDMRLVAENGSLYYPWLLDPSTPSVQAIKGDNYRDNVEKLEFNLPEAKPYKLVISHKGELKDGSQDFSLIIKYQSALSTSKTLYWVGDEGDWGDNTNWSLSSGGSPALIIPGPEDHVIIDENSFDGSGSDQIMFNQNRSCLSVKWLTEKISGFTLQGNTLTIGKELTITSSNFQSVGTGIIMCNTMGAGVTNFSDTDLGDLTLLIDQGDWTLRGNLKIKRLELSAGNLVIEKSQLEVDQFSESNQTNIKALAVNQSELRINDQSDFNILSLSLESQDSKIVFENSAVELNWNGVSFNGLVEIIASTVTINGNNNSVDDLRMREGATLVLDDGSNFHANTISKLSGEPGNPITISSPTIKSSITSTDHFLLCADYLSISNVDFFGSSGIYAGLNSTIINSLNWQEQTCASALFADFDESYLCQNGFTEFHNRSIGSIDSYAWEIQDASGIINTSNSENSFQEFNAAGLYLVKLTVKNSTSEHTYAKQIEILPTNTVKNEVAVNSDQLASVATSSSYQWFLNEQKIIGATSRTYEYQGAEGAYRVVTYDGACNRSSNLVTITGLADEQFDDVMIYPNPADETITIEVRSQSPGWVVLNDNLGRTIFESKLDQHLSIPLQPINDGSYILLLRQANKTIVKKILVQHKN